jgi:hypothetical protein
MAEAGRAREPGPGRFRVENHRTAEFRTDHDWGGQERERGPDTQVICQAECLEAPATWTSRREAIGRNWRPGRKGGRGKPIP